MPAALYTYGEKEDVMAAQGISERAAQGDEMSDEELTALMLEESFDHLYVGPAAALHGGFSAERLRKHGRLEELFDTDGVHIFRFTR